MHKTKFKTQVENKNKIDNSKPYILIYFKLTNI